MKGVSDTVMDLPVTVIVALIIFALVIFLIIASKIGIPVIKDITCGTCNGLRSSFSSYITAITKIFNPCSLMFNCCDETVENCNPSGGTTTTIR